MPPPHHGHLSVSRLHLCQLCPTGSHQYIILLVRTFCPNKWYVHTFPTDTQLIVWKVLPSMFNLPLMYYIIGGAALAKLTQFRNWVVIHCPLSLSIARYPGSGWNGVGSSPSTMQSSVSESHCELSSSRGVISLGQSFLFTCMSHDPLFSDSVMRCSLEVVVGHD